MYIYVYIIYIYLRYYKVLLWTINNYKMRGYYVLFNHNRILIEWYLIILNNLFILREF